MPQNTSPSQTKTINEAYYDIVETLCSRFVGLSPFEVINQELRDVYDLYVDIAIHDFKNKKKEGWVTSKTASWH